MANKLVGFLVALGGLVHVTNALNYPILGWFGAQVAMVLLLVAGGVSIYVGWKDLM